MTQKKDINEEVELQNEATAETAGNEQTTDETAATETAETDKVAALEAELEQMKDKYLRQVAEFDNYRKRTIKEKADLILNGGEKVLGALLPVLDDLERAEANIEKSDDVATLKEGVCLIIDKLNKALSAQGLKKMECIGQPFDTDFHEAVALIPAQQEEQKNQVIDCVQSGYTINEKVIRHAKVVVGQ